MSEKRFSVKYRYIDSKPVVFEVKFDTSNRIDKFLTVVFEKLKTLVDPQSIYDINDFTVEI